MNAWLRSWHGAGNSVLAGLGMHGAVSLETESQLDMHDGGLDHCRQLRCVMWLTDRKGVLKGRKWRTGKGETLRQGKRESEAELSSKEIQIGERMLIHSAFTVHL